MSDTTPLATPVATPRRAYRDLSAPVAGGVASGLAAHLAVPVLWVRVFFVATALLGGFGLMLYANWANMPFVHRLPLALAFIAPVIAVGGVWFVPPILLWALWVQVKYDMGTFDGGGAWRNPERP